MFLLPISIISFVVKYKANFFGNEQQEIIKEEPIIVNVIDKNLKLELEEYIIGVVAGEMPALFEEETLKAQAIASRSYALSKRVEKEIQISSTINEQVFLTKEEMQEKWQDDYRKYYEKIKKCVYATENLVLKRNNKILKAYYFAMSNGYTENSEAVFGENLIDSQESKWDNNNIKNFTVQVTKSESEILEKLNLKEKVLTIGKINRNETNRVVNIEINNISFTGVEIRKLLSLRSTDFEIKKENNNYIITTKGYGHGVGMSQYGANGMAKDGYIYSEILNHYYNDVKITKI